MARAPNITAMAAPPIRAETYRRRREEEEEERPGKMRRRPSPGELARGVSGRSSTRVSRPRRRVGIFETTERLENPDDRNLLWRNPALWLLVVASGAAIAQAAVYSGRRR